MWIAQVAEGAFCVIMGLATTQYETPESGLAKEISLSEHDSGKKYLLLPSHDDYFVVGCSSVDIPAPD
eukprot:6209378-Pleurochrysis_carterae.AAC.3